MKAWRTVAARCAGLASLAVLVWVGWMLLGQLRADLAFARFWQARMMAEVASDAELRDRAVRQGTLEVETMLLAGSDWSDALWNASRTCSRWASLTALEPMLRLYLADCAYRAALRCVQVGPSDWEAWLRLSNSAATIGLDDVADKGLDRARALAPPGAIGSSG